jgi:hypothetical protein
MSTKYNIITKTTYKDFCEKTDDIQIVENYLEKRKITLLDKFGNKCQIDYNEDDTILALTRIGVNDPVYILYLLVTLADAMFLSEDAFKNCIQVPLLDKPDTQIVEITNDVYEEFTRYFLDYVKHARDFNREFQLFTEAKRADSKTIKDVTNSLEEENDNNLKIISTGKEQKKLNEYFELDEDFEIEKINIENQKITPKITSLLTYYNAKQCK